MIYSGDFSDLITDHGTGVLLTGIGITNQTNTNSRKGESWTFEEPHFYSVTDWCSILDSIPAGANVFQHTNNPAIEGTDNGKTKVLFKPDTRLGPFISDTKIVIDYYRDDKYVAQSNWICLKDWFLIIAPPTEIYHRAPNRAQSFHGMGHVLTHASSKASSIFLRSKEPYWFMNWMNNHHCIYDDSHNGTRITDLYFQVENTQYELNYGMCNILTGASS